MLEDSAAASTFIETIIDAKLNGTPIEPDVRETLHRNLLERLESRITAAILALLTEQEQLELEHLVDTNQTAKIEDYLTVHGVNLDRTLAGVMVEFQATYLGV